MGACRGRCSQIVQPHILNVQEASFIHPKSDRLLESRGPFQVFVVQKTTRGGSAFRHVNCSPTDFLPMKKVL